MTLGTREGMSGGSIGPPVEPFPTCLNSTGPAGPKSSLRDLPEQSEAGPNTSLAKRPCRCGLKKCRRLWTVLERLDLPQLNQNPDSNGPIQFALIDERVVK